MPARNKWLSRCVLCSPGGEKIPGTTMVLIHQGAVRVEPEPVTAIQEGGQRPTAGLWPPLTNTAADGTTRTRPLTATALVEAPRQKATGGATIAAQTTDAPLLPLYPHLLTLRMDPISPFVRLWTTKVARRGRCTWSRLIWISGSIYTYPVNAEQNFPVRLIRLVHQAPWKQRLHFL